MQNNKKIKIMTNTFTIILFAIMGLLIYSIYLINGVESEIRYIVMAIIFIINILLAIFLRKLLKKPKLSKYIAFILLTAILIAIQGTIAYYIFSTYSSLSGMNKEKITYETAIVTLKDADIENEKNLNNNKIGIVVDETSIDGYVIGLEIIEDLKLKDTNTIVEYTDLSKLVSDLYNKKIDAIIISKNYSVMFKSIKEYQDIETKTKIIYTKEKTLTKSEIAKYTGDEILNANKSNKITEPFTVLVMGIDSTADTLSKGATGNGDALMLVTFNPKTLNATILSIPRDTYVPIACFSGQKENKITHAAWNGESCMIKTIENFTGINIDYYVKINFKGVVKLVNALDGINVNVPIEFCESNSNRSTKTANLICLKKGNQTLNGEQALALARHRKTLPTGDLQRGVNQQLVVQGMLNKVKTISSANQLLDILNTISQNMDTNFTTNQILSFYNIAKNILLTSSASGNLINMQQLYLSGSGKMIYDEGMGLTLYNYIPNTNSLQLIIDAMKENLGNSNPKQIKTMDFNIEEKYEMKTIGTDVLPSQSTTSSYTVLPNFVGKTSSYATNWLSNNGIRYSVIEKLVTSDAGYKDGEVMTQNVASNKRIDLIGSAGVTITVAKVKKETTTTPPTTPEVKDPEPTTPEDKDDEQGEEKPTTPEDKNEPTIDNTDKDNN